MTQNKIFAVSLLALAALARVLTSDAYVAGAQLEADGYAAFADKLSGRLDADAPSSSSFEPALGLRSLTSLQESA